MKVKRFAALILALAAALSLAAAPAGAVTFSDLAGHWSRADVEDVAGRGLVKGYTDGTFKPDNRMTCCEALLFCSRAAGIPASDKARIADARAGELKELLPADMIGWASEEMAVCLETGILTPTELKALSEAGSLSRSISRENLAMYLTRAMQLAPLAENLSSYTMSFSDAGSISPALQPYVYLLNSYGIIQGNESNQFLPKNSLTRGEMATMLRRAVDFMESRGIVAELPAYTTNTWTGGVITNVTTGEGGASLVTLTSALSGARSVTLPAAAQIYENNMATNVSALRPGKYARVNFNGQGVAVSVRLGGELETLTGAVASLDNSHILLTLEGSEATRLLDIDRFTAIQIGTEVGDSSLIDLEAGYTAAVCQVDEMGHLATLRLSGGTREVRGLVGAVENASGGGQALQLTGFDGTTTRYIIPLGVTVQVDHLPGTLSSAQAGHLATLRVSREEGQVVSVSVDTTTSYVQGGIRSVDTERTGNGAITITDPLTNKAVTYYMDPNALLTYNGSAISFREVRSGWFATLLVSDSSVLMLDAYPGSTAAEGVISSITYGLTTTIDVTLDDQSVSTFTLDMNNLPPIYRSGRSSSVDKLRVGDQVIVTIRYNRVEEIEATPQSANVSGTIARITMEGRGISMDLTLPTGETERYEIAEGVSVLQNNQAVSLYALKPGYEISMVVVSGEVASIEVDRASTSDGILSGTVILVNEKDRLLMVSTGGSTVITVSAVSAELRAASGSALAFRDLAVGDTLQIFGAYSGSTFVSTIIIRM